MVLHKFARESFAIDSDKLPHAGSHVIILLHSGNDSSVTALSDTGDIKSRIAFAHLRERCGKVLLISIVVAGYRTVRGCTYIGADTNHAVALSIRNAEESGLPSGKVHLLDPVNHQAFIIRIVGNAAQK